MISCLLVQILHNPQGVPIRKESVVSGEVITIGRGAACKIHLLDHRVNLLHASLRRSEDGTLYIEAEKDEAIGINGFIEQDTAITPGMRVEMGPYLFLVEAMSTTHDITLSVELTEPLPAALIASRSAPLTLAALGVSKRKWSLMLAAFILFIGLFLPLLPGVSSSFDKWQANLPVTLNGMWSPGQLSGGHRVFGAQCSICHLKAFQEVEDDVCIGCHKAVAKHLKGDTHANVFVKSRCTDCHSDHRGEARPGAHSSKECITCHGNIKRKSMDATLANVTDLTKDHPQFSITLRNGKDAVRVRLDEKNKLVEKSGLKYSHKVHLDKRGVSSPMGDMVMVCRDCHKIDAAGEHFMPMTMEKSCQQSRCHALDFTDPVQGVAPHGSEREVMNRLREFYTKWLIDPQAKNMAVCENSGGNEVQRVLDCANDLARKNAGATLFREKLECGECHEIQPTGKSDVPWKVTPLHINRDWMPDILFSHAKHATMNCVDCHDKANSKTSADISMPGIEKCYECHVGERSHLSANKIRSPCESCHRFHKGAKKSN